MKRYNARRRFRAGIMAAKTISALSGKKHSNPQVSHAAVKHAEATPASPTATEGTPS
ncbi:hypothetical protein PINS_up000669 [Pythium insidiosum]|nr:hypothetical protein PINS_up000669 [Pythium insidiosum]